MLRTVLAMCLAVACLVVSQAALASPLTYIIEGTLTVKTDPSGLAPMVAVGDRVTYAMTFDSETPNLNMPGQAVYEGISASLEIGANTFTCEPPWAVVTANWSLSNASTFKGFASTSLGGVHASGQFALTDWDKASIDDDRLPLVPYDLTLFEERYFQISIPNPSVYGDVSRLSGSFDKLTIVPEPASLSILAFAVGSCLITRKSAR